MGLFNAIADDAMKEVDRVSTAYAGRAVIRRLVLLSAPGGPLPDGARQEAQRRAIDLVRSNTLDASLLEYLDPSPESKQWVHDAQRQFNHLYSIYHSNLLAGKRSGDRTQIYNATIDIADVYAQAGDMGYCFAKLSLAREYAPTPADELSLSLRIATAALECSGYSAVHNEFANSQHLKQVAPVMFDKLRTCNAIAYLAEGNFGQAARSFLDIRPSVCDSFPDLIVARDIGLCAGICALASFSRAEIKSAVLDTDSFLPFLELHSEVHSLIRDFDATRHASFISRLHALVPEMRLDLFLSPHVTKLVQSATDAALIQYIVPFASIDLCRMSAAFGTNVDQLERNLASLIQSGKVAAVIDGQRKIMWSKSIDPRTAAFQKAMEVGENVVADATALLFRVNMLRAGMNVQNSVAEENDRKPDLVPPFQP